MAEVPTFVLIANPFNKDIRPSSVEALRVGTELVEVPKIMIIFLYGPDSYRSQEKVNEIIERYKESHKSGLNLKYLNAKETDFQDFENIFKVTSMFEETKLVVLQNTFLNQKFQEDFLDKVDGLVKSKDVTLVHEKDPVSDKNKLFKALENKAKTQEFGFLGGVKLTSWVKRGFDDHQAKIAPDAIEELVNYVGNDLWQMDNEIKKLVNFKKGKMIEVEDVYNLVRPKIEVDIFKTIDALAEKNKKRALKLLHNHLDKGDSPLYLLSMINFQFRNLLVVKELVDSYKPYDVILKKTGLHPFVVRKSISQAGKFALEELKKIYRNIFQVDLDIKTGRIKPEVALDMLVAGI